MLAAISCDPKDSVLLGLLLVFAVTITSLMAASNAWAASEPALPITDIPRVDGVPVAGTVADWKGQGLAIRALAGENALLRPSGEFEVAARLGWTDEGVLLQVDVTDSTPWEQANASRLYEGDCVELFLMTADKAAGLTQVVASPGRTGDQTQVRVKLLDYRAMAFKKDAAPFAPRAVAKKTDRGYVMDMLLPWASMKIKPQIGTVVGVRFCVNDSDGQNQQRAGWANWQTNPAWWMDLPMVRLADKPATAKTIAVWGGYDGFKSVYVNAIAEPQAASKSLQVLDGGKVVAQGQLAMDGGRAIARITLPFPPVGQTLGNLTVQLDGQTVHTVQLPDAVKLRKDLFLSGQNSSTDKASAWLRPVCQAEVFAGSELPKLAYPDPERIKQLVGAFTLETAYFDARFNRVQKAAGPGRYGAVTTVIAANGDSFVRYQTLYCLAKDAATPAQSAAMLAALGANPDATDFDAARADRDWWHALRKKLGTATRYEYFVRLPGGYDADPAKRWPVIFYLHGSGGGDNPQNARDDGIQFVARDRADFPFIAVSLRSPGGWFPPAVHDVIDEVLATCRVDPSRCYLTGFSMGGMGTWAVAQDRPERFAAIAAVGGRHGDLARAARLKGLATWVINGADDTTTTSADALKMVDALRAASAEVKWTEIPGAGHVDSLNTAYRWDELYAWFLQHHR